MTRRSVGLVAALLVVGSALAFPWLRIASGDDPAPGLCASAAGPDDGDARYVRELVELIERTKSIDVFTASFVLLSQTKADPKRYTPMLIRNAERVGIFANHLRNEQSAGHNTAAEVWQMIARYRHMGEMREQLNMTGGEAPPPLWPTERIEEKLAEPGEFRSPVLPPKIEAEAPYKEGPQAKAPQTMPKAS